MLTNKYTLLVLVNLPLIIVGVVSAVTAYKTSRISRKKCLVQVLFWLSVGVGLSFIEPLYDALIRHNLTDSPPMSIFDVVLLTLVLFCFMLIKRANEKNAELNKRISRMHENIVIAEEQRHWDK